MPRTTREWSHRKLDESRNNLSWAIVHLEDVRERYAERPELLDQAIAQIQATILLADDLVRLLKDSY